MSALAEPVLSLGLTDWLQLTLHFALLSLLAVGGAITTTPDMHRYLVTRQGWLSEAQFNASIAIAQAAPGPNVLFIALLGWNVGLNNGAGGPSLGWALLGACTCLAAVLLPSSTLVYLTARWSHANRERRGVRAFKQGLAPLVVALLISTGWILASTQAGASADLASAAIAAWPFWLLTVATALLVWRTRLHLLWLLGTGAVLGVWLG
ncbi:chromate transporter [Hylemonella gracilis str. Niagara R]|uniref:Chromate transporter n=1 Tax=Hylemonella gracilis str. Niagara R TaxID=1458275 RepID=A0A016XHH7_9BURK|nr:chromate transporter [Hylemonella gracilis]EYC51311.1 chromate transporter [Hylemonella gracilis str. Niagara R]